MYVYLYIYIYLRVWSFVPVFGQYSAYRQEEALDKIVFDDGPGGGT